MELTSFIIFFLILSLTYALVIVERVKTPRKDSYTLEFIFICSAVIFILYKIFFFYAPYFTNLNDSYPLESYTPLIKGWVAQHDGVEGFVLYAFMLASLTLCWIASWTLSTFKKKWHVIIMVVACLFTTDFLVLQIGWHPPVPGISENGKSTLYLLLGSIIFTVFFLWLNRFSFYILFTLIVILLIPICFISVRPFEMFDYSFIWAPAYRLLNGYSLAEIYFQYDLLLSMFAAGWMKLGWDLGYFPLLGQLSFYIFFLFCLAFSKRFFFKSDLYIFFFLSLLIVRYFAIDHEPTQYFQVVPFRLDLWVLIVALIYHKGVHHWSSALGVGVMILIHKNFGLLYLGSYVQLLLLLTVLDFLDYKNSRQINFETAKYFIIQQARLNYKNVIILIGFLTLTAYLFDGLVPTSALLYQKIGIGMIPISNISFYWYVPVLLSVTFMLLLNCRSILSRNYFVASCFLIFASIANSMYFFGRSHEHNIINISAILVWVFFLLLDLIFLKLEKRQAHTDNFRMAKIIKIKNSAVYIIAFLFLIAVVYTYSGRIINRLNQQYGNLIALNFGHSSIEPQFRDRVEKIKILTNHSDRVYIFDLQNDFIYTYIARYEPVGYFFPVSASVFNKEMFDFMQSLLNNGYYIVVDAGTLNWYQSLPLVYSTEKSGDNFKVLKLGDDFPKPERVENLPSPGDDVMAYVDGITDSTSFYKIEGWSFIKNKDDTNSKISLILKSPNAQLKFACVKRYRPDLKDAFHHSFNTDASGFETRLKKDYFEKGEYELFVLIENSSSFYVKSLDKRITF